MRKTYTTISGDMWDVIAKRELGGERYTDLLMKSNPAYLGVVVFPAGMILVIPEIDTPIPEVLPPWKR